jgi:transposase InsO family protein
VVSSGKVCYPDTMFLWSVLFQSCYNWSRCLQQVIRAYLRRRQSLVLENLALRSQLALFEQQVLAEKRPKPRPTPAFRLLWVFLSSIMPNWESALMLVTPATVIRWHRTWFRWYWRRKSKTRGRPALAKDIIARIKQIHRENPLWSPERIHDQLVQLGLTGVPAPNTIAKYLPTIRKTPDAAKQQSWRTFLANHRRQIWAMDFFMMPTLYFKVLYVLVIISHDRRVIKHIAVTAHPSAEWVAQQLREATPFGEHPRYLIHDNDSIFRSQVVRKFLANAGIQSIRTSYRHPQQNGIAERVVGIIRRELLDYLIPVNEQHLLQILHEYIQQYYHPVRTHQGIKRQTPIPPASPPASADISTPLQAKPLLGGLYHNYKRAA